MTRKTAELCVNLETPLRDVMSCIGREAVGIALVVDEERRLVGTITDGDVRRAILDGAGLNSSAAALLDRKTGTIKEPITAAVDCEQADLLHLMQTHKVRHIPILDDQRRVAGLVCLEDLLPAEAGSFQAVIMAGGYGTRLRPLTADLPKPMLPVGDRPLMELIIQQLRQAGIRRVNVTTHYQPEKIRGYFGDGEAFGVELRYVSEDQPLGTAGALALMEQPSEPLLVVNGDILTRLDFRALLAYHRDHRGDLTVAVREHRVDVPYGVVECSGPLVRELREKPSFTLLVSAGIYLLEPSVHQYIPNGQRFDMPDLIRKLLADGRRVVSFPIVEYWLDVGKAGDYEEAQREVRNGSFVK